VLTNHYPNLYPDVTTGQTLSLGNMNDLVLNAHDIVNTEFVSYLPTQVVEIYKNVSEKMSTMS